MMAWTHENTDEDGVDKDVDSGSSSGWLHLLPGMTEHTYSWPPSHSARAPVHLNHLLDLELPGFFIPIIGRVGYQWFLLCFERFFFIWPTSGLVLNMEHTRAG